MMERKPLSDKQLGAILARNLNRLLKEKNLLQKELAAECNLSDATLSRYLNNKQYPGGLMLVRLARALEVTIEELIH